MNKQYILLFIFLTSISLSIFAQQSPIGWASFGNGTTGGSGGESVTVTTRSEFVAAVSNDNDPRVVRIRDTVELNLYERVIVRSNKTIIGITTKAMLRYGGIEIQGNNVIVRNLIIRDSYDGDWDGKTHSTDAITVYGQNVWIDHCWLAASADGLCDIRSSSSNVADYVTVSYTRFSDHNKVSLIGASDDNTQDRDHLKTTFHHCWFDGTLEKGLNQRLPRIRYGDIHLYNNYFENVASYCILARIESDVVVENNYFRRSSNPHGLEDFGLGMKDPELVASGNIYELSGGNMKTSGDAFVPADFYDYELMDAISVPAYVMNEAGPFNNPGNHDPVAVLDTVTLADDDRVFNMDLTLNDLDEDGDDLRIGTIINEPDGRIAIQNNSLRYIPPTERLKADTILYELVDTEGGMDIGTFIVNFEGLATAVKQVDVQEFQIYPNPVRNDFIISYQLRRPQEHHIEIADLNGQVVMQKNIDEFDNTLNQHISCERLTSGCWIIAIHTAEEIVSKRLIVL